MSTLSPIDERAGLDRRAALMTLIGAAVLSPVAALGQTAAPVALGPTEFRTMALMGGEFALRTSQLALERSRNPRIREFAQLESNEQISYAAALGATPGGVPLRADQARMLEQLAATAPGPRFDALYVRGQIMGHQELLELNQAYAQGGFDPQGRSVATIAVPSIQTHLTILNRLI
jgi:putative membrane protein